MQAEMPLLSQEQCGAVVAAVVGIAAVVAVAVAVAPVAVAVAVALAVVVAGQEAAGSNPVG